MALVLENHYPITCDFGVTTAEGGRLWTRYHRTDDYNDAFDHFVSPDIPEIVENTLVRVYDENTHRCLHFGMMHEGRVMDGDTTEPLGSFSVDKKDWIAAWNSLEELDELMRFCCKTKIQNVKIRDLVFACIQIAFEFCPFRPSGLEKLIREAKYPSLVDLTTRVMTDLRTLDNEFYAILESFNVTFPWNEPIDNYPSLISLQTICNNTQRYAWNKNGQDRRMMKLIRERVSIEELIVRHLRDPERRTA